MDRAKTLTQLPDGGYGKNIAEALRKVCKEEGVMPGLYRGLPVAMVREASKNMFRIGTYCMYFPNPSDFCPYTTDTCVYNHRVVRPNSARHARRKRRPGPGVEAFPGRYVYRRARRGGF
jgi:hypothetical protein